MLNYFYESGLDVILYLQSWGDWLVAPMQWFTFLGNEEFFLLIMPILYWCLDAVLGLRVSLVLLLSASLNVILKLGFHTPRPYWVYTQVQAYDSEFNFGIPSGHAMFGISMWGFFAVQINRFWGWIIFGMLILMIGFSRVFLGVHFPIDVILGWILGVTFLWLYLRFEEPIANWLTSLRASGRLWVSLAVALLLVTLGGLTLRSLGDWRIPMSWIDNARVAFPNEPPIDPLSLADLITITGSLFGLTAGAIWLFAGQGYHVRGSLTVRLLRIPVGLIGVLVIWLGLGAILPDGADLLAYTFRFLRYALVGLWISALAPLTFVRLGLARRESG